MSYAETLTNPAGLLSAGVGTAVAMFMPNDGAPGRDFAPTAKAEQAAAGSGTVSSFLPTVSSIAEVTYNDAGFGPGIASVAVPGSYVLTLLVASGDTVNAPSPLDRIVLPPGARVVTATG